MMKLFSELRRRHVFRVAAGYAVVAWLVIQVTATVFPLFGAPDWVLRVVVGLLVLGLPIALVVAWGFDLTPEGIQRAEPVLPGESDAPGGRLRWIGPRSTGWLGVGLLVGLASVGAYGSIRSADRAGPELAEPATARSIAVLPFANVSSDPESEYFSEGISEEILNALSQIPQLRVAARTSAFSFRGTAVPIDSIARALGVENVLEGSVRTVDGRVRITARLVDAPTGTPLWSNSYNREASDILLVQEEIAVAIANALQVRLAGDETSLTRSRTTNPVAYELYLQGRHLVSKRTGPDLTEGVRRFEAALERDPAFAAAYSGLSDAYALLEDYGGMSRDEAFPKSIAAAQRALELDELQAEAHTSLGHVYFEQRNWAAAETAYQRALELNPSYALAHHWYGNLLQATGRYEEAGRAFDRALALNPLSMTIRSVWNANRYYNRRFDEAVAGLREAVAANPDAYHANYWLGWAHLGAGNHEEAIAAMRRTLELIQPDGPASVRTHRAQLAVAYAAAGRREDAAGILREVEESLSSDLTLLNTLYYVALAYDLLGDRDLAFTWLGRAVERPTWMRDVLRFHPAFDGLREDPRFEEILERVEGGSAADR